MANNNTNHIEITRNIKISIATLENELESYKKKYRKLEEMFINSERICYYLSIKYSKYLPILNELGKLFFKNKYILSTI